jgi:plastocyanin
MNGSRHRRRAGALLGVFAMLCVLTEHDALAGMVTVNVTTPSGTAAEDAVVVFDPLDEAPVAARDAAVIDQINKKFVPRVTVVRSGTAITFPNSDRIRHQVYSFSPAKTFTLKLYAGSPKTAVTFDHPGLVVLGCNIHDSMVAFIAVVDSPYFAKTSDAGTATLNLPAGRYRLRAWHPSAVNAVPPRDITIAAAPLTLPLAIDVDTGSAIVAVWPE